LTEELGARHSEVKRLRALLRDRQARADGGALVLEGPRVIAGALDRGAALDSVYLGPHAEQAFAPLVERLRGNGTRIVQLREGVLEKVGTTRTPQPVLAIAASPSRGLEALVGGGTVLVATDIADPGNLGTIIRSAEAAGVDGVVVCGTSVDVSNPKAVRSSAGALFGVTVAEADDPVDVLDALAANGRRTLGATPVSGDRYDALDLTGACALVVGNEAHGLAPAILRRLDGMVSIPMAAGAESLNVAMAVTVLLFEAARQRRLATATR
jgi:TrmH family RNA methyltransferase